MITKLTSLALFVVIINMTEIRAEDTEFDMQKLKTADMEEITAALSEDEYADESEVRLYDITYKPLQKSSTSVSDETVEEILGQIISGNTTIINAVSTNLSTPVAEDNAQILAIMYNHTDADGVIDDSTTGEIIIPKLQMTDELTNMTEESESSNEIMTTELYNMTSVWMEVNPTNKVIEARELQLSGNMSSSGRTKSSNTANEVCEITDNGPKEGLNIEASLESNRTANSSEPFCVDQKYKVDVANKDFNPEEILRRYEEIVNDDSESQFKFCKNGQCNDCKNETIMNTTERTICFTFHNFKEDFEDIRAMERMLQNSTKTSLDTGYEVMEKVCFNIQENQFKLTRQQQTTTECGIKSTAKKKKKKFLKGRKFWPHHNKN